jgi:hypothetical protein
MAIRASSRRCATPPTGLEWGCKVFAHRLAVAQGNIHEALLCWNGGSTYAHHPERESRDGGNLAYPDQVLARVDKYR